MLPKQLYSHSFDGQSETIKGLITGKTYNLNWRKSYASYLVASQKGNRKYLAGKALENSGKLTKIEEKANVHALFKLTK